MAKNGREVLQALAPCIVLGGQAGVDKTTVALNLALDAAAAGYRCTLIDLDVVNPYFRSSEAREELEAAGVRLLAPQFAEAGTNLDAPALTAAIEPALDDQLGDAHGKRLIIDLGGEADGALTLGRFVGRFHQANPADYGLYGIVNASRTFSATPQEVTAHLQTVAAACRLEWTGLIDNTHLMEASDLTTFQRGLNFTRAVGAALGVPVVFSTVPPTLSKCGDEQLTEVAGDELLYPVKLHLQPPWLV